MILPHPATEEQPASEIEVLMPSRPSDRSTAEVLLSFDSGRAYVTLNRPDKHNGLTLTMLGQLVRAARTVHRRKDIRVVILSGNGPSFCSGLDIAGAVGNPLAVLRNFAPVPWRGTNTFQEACWAWRRLPQPVIAAVHGHCYGGGLQLALAADIRCASSDSDFSIMEARHGLVPDMTAAVTLSRLVGVDRALLLAMTADPVDASYAERIGLVTQLTDDPRQGAEDLADRIAARPARAVAASKRLFDRAWHAGVWRAFAAERSAQLPLLIRRAADRNRH